MARFLILTGILITILGLILSFTPRLKLPLLPGDILLKGDNYRFYFPITSSLILSLLISFIAKILSG